MTGIKRRLKKIETYNVSGRAKSALLSVMEEVPDVLFMSGKITLNTGTSNLKSSVCFTVGTVADEVKGNLNRLDIECDDTGIGIESKSDAGEVSYYYRYDSLFRDRFGRQTEIMIADLWRVLPATFWDEVDRHSRMIGG